MSSWMYFGSELASAGGDNGVLEELLVGSGVASGHGMAKLIVSPPRFQCFAPTSWARHSGL